MILMLWVSTDSSWIVTSFNLNCVSKTVGRRLLILHMKLLIRTYSTICDRNFSNNERKQVWFPLSINYSPKFHITSSRITILSKQKPIIHPILLLCVHTCTFTHTCINIYLYIYLYMHIVRCVTLELSF